MTDQPVTRGNVTAFAPVSDRADTANGETDVVRLQSSGCLLVIDSALEVIQSATETTQTVLGRAAAKLTGQPLTEVLSPQSIHDVGNAVTRSTAVRHPETLHNLSTCNGVLDGWVYVSGDVVILELVPYRRKLEERVGLLDGMQWMLRSETDAMALAQRLEETALYLQYISGFEYSEILRLDKDHPAQSLACYHNGIPQPSVQTFEYNDFGFAENYATCSDRVLASCDIDAPLTRFAIHDDLSGRPDFSLSMLLALPDAVQQRLRQDGTRSVILIPFRKRDIRGGIALTSPRVRTVDPTLVSILQMTAQIFASTYEAYLSAEREELRIKCRTLCSILMAPGKTMLISRDSWKEGSEALCRFLKCDGVALIGPDRKWTHGAVAPDAILSALATAALDHDRSVWRKPFPAADGSDRTGQADLIRLLPASELALVAFQTHAPEGGCTDTSDVTDRLTLLRDTIDPALAEAIAQSQAREHMDVMVHELNHRVRNSLALIQSVVKQTQRTAESVSEYAAALNDRILALAHAHDLLAQSHSKAISLSEVIRREAHVAAKGQFSFSGPDCGIAASASMMVVLVLHEMFSNALKHGALSHEGGKVDLRWSIEGEDLTLAWTETGMRNLKPSERRGFGMLLIENALKYELGGQSSMEFYPTGLVTELTIPREYLYLPEATTNTTSHGAGVGVRHDMLKLGTVLIVEDNYTIARVVATMVEEFGAKKTITASNNETALEIIASTHVDFAVLDINLFGHSCLPTAEKLAEMRIPFLFTTGYSEYAKEVHHMRDVPLLSKPLRAEALQNALANLLHSRLVL